MEESRSDVVCTKKRCQIATVKMKYENERMRSENGEVDTEERDKQERRNEVSARK